jgi:hypothetical protein
MVSIRRRILLKGQLIKEQFIRTLQDHEDRIAALEKGDDPAPATRDLSFTINDGTDAIGGATVKVGSKTATTGSAGGCTITGVEEGSVSVEVSAEGYVTKTETITVDASHTSFTISLTAS